MTKPSEQYLTRSDARHAARHLGYKVFRTKWDADHQAWRVIYEQGERTPADDWAQDKDFVAWTEVVWDGGTRVGVLVVTITKPELAELDLEIPKEFLIEPITPELWAPQRPQGTRNVTPRVNPDYKAPTPSARTGRNTVSTVEGPKALCWRIAAEMTAQGKSRKEIVAACIAAGVGKNTASTQFYLWRKANEGTE